MNCTELRRLWLMSACIMASAALMTGCVGEETGDEEVSDEAAFTEVIPSGDILEVTLSAEGDGQALTVEQALEGQPSRIADHASRTAQRIETAREVTERLVRAVFDASEAKEETINGRDCRTFKHDDGTNVWRLFSCVQDKRAKRFGFALLGRPNDGTAEDFKVVMAGEGAVLPRFEGKRRGAGVVGYNLDALNALRGEGPTGKVAIGYRAAGRFRQVTAAFKGFQAVGGDQDFSSVYRFNHVVGKGGLLKFAFKADVVSRDGGELSEDPDGVDEFGRVALAYSRSGKARVAGILCGGSVGEGDCVRLRECFEANETVNFEAYFLESGDRPEFDSVACPGEDELPIMSDEEPSEGELEPEEGDNGGDIPGPVVDEPAEDSAMEG